MGASAKGFSRAVQYVVSCIRFNVSKHDRARREGGSVGRGPDEHVASDDRENAERTDGILYQQSFASGPLFGMRQP